MTLKKHKNDIKDNAQIVEIVDAHIIYWDSMPELSTHAAYTDASMSLNEGKENILMMKLIL